MIAKANTWDDIDALNDLWVETLGECIPRGFMTFSARAPLLKQCLEESSQERLHRCIRDKAKDGRVY